MLKEVLSKIDSKKDELIELTKELVRQPSTSGNEYLVAEIIGAKLKSLGLEVIQVEPEKGKTSVIATYKGKEKGYRLLYNGHIDVVEPGDLDKWTYPPFEPTIVGNKLYGRGTVDMKGAIAAFIIALESIITSGIDLKGEVVIAAVADEEKGGHLGTKYLAENGYLQADMAIVGECSEVNHEPAVSVASSGVCWLLLKTYGKSIHPAMEKKGIDAVFNMCRLVLRLKSHKFNFKSHPYVPDVTIVPAFYIKGGTGANTVPDYCEAKCDIRPVPGMTKEGLSQEIWQIIEELKAEDPNFAADFEVLLWAEPTEIKSDEFIVQKIVQAGQDVLGRPTPIEKRPGTTDARYINAIGIPTVNALGPGNMVENNMHGIDENVDLDSLLKYSKLYAGTILKVCR